MQFTLITFSCEFACQPSVLKMFLDSRCLRSEFGIVWQWYFQVSLHINSSPIFLLRLNQSALWWLRGTMFWTLWATVVGLLVKRVLKTFPGPGYLRSKDWMVWLQGVHTDFAKKIPGHFQDKTAKLQNNNKTNSAWHCEINISRENSITTTVTLISYASH